MDGNQVNQEAVKGAADFVKKFNTIILEPLILLLMAVAFLVFVWGTAEYLVKANSDEARKKGRKHMIWGLFGLFVMVSAWSILTIATGTFGLDDELDCGRNPLQSGCDSAFIITPPGGR